MKKNKIVFICPYFGKLPYDQLRLVFKTMEYNPLIDWIIITDDHTKFKHPSNVKFLYDTLSNLKNNIKTKFDFEICLDTPYKLCDFKPTYGYIFPDLVDGYEYWGHCDFSDAFYGDIQKYLLEAIKDKPEKVGVLGHLTLYRNTKENNERFKIKTKSNVELKDILGVPENKAFDEVFPYGINNIYLENNIKIKRIEDIFFDATCAYTPLVSTRLSDDYRSFVKSKIRYIIEWDKGKLFKVHLDNNKIVREEIGYVHYQKRKVDYKINFDNPKHFIFYYNTMIDIDKLDTKLIKKYTKKKVIDRMHIKILKKNMKLFINKRVGKILKK